MDAGKAMELIEQFETRIGQMYARLEKLFLDDKELSGMFGRLQTEESNHANIAAMQKRIVRSKPSDFGEVHLNFSDFKQSLDYIDVVMAMPRDKVKEILVQCYLIESSMVEQYVVAALRGNPEIRPMLETLNQGFRDHLAELAARVQQLGVDVGSVDTIRQLPRVVFSEKIMVNEKISGKSVDISESGIFMLTTQSFPADSIVTLFFSIGGGTIRTRAVVRYSVPNAGMGLNFLELSGRDKQLIRNHVEKALDRARLDPEKS